MRFLRISIFIRRGKQYRHGEWYTYLTTFKTHFSGFFGIEKYRKRVSTTLVVLETRVACLV